MIFINLKTYKEGTGENALTLVKILEDVADETQIKIIPVVQASDLKEISQSTKLEVWVQKVDFYEFGAHTGAIIPEAVLEDGCVGTFLNHSESKISLTDLEKTVKRCAEVGLKTLVFAANLEELNNVLSLKPTFVSFEPPELVGSKSTSVAREKPEIIADAVEASKKAGIPLIVGAGIKSSEDVKTSIKLGAAGVAVASDIVLASDPKKELFELVEGFG